MTKGGKGENGLHSLFRVLECPRFVTDLIGSFAVKSTSPKEHPHFNDGNLNLDADQTASEWFDCPFLLPDGPSGQKEIILKRL